MFFNYRCGVRSGLWVWGQEAEEAPARKRTNAALGKARDCCPFASPLPARSEAKPKEKTAADFPSSFIATPRIKGAQHTYYATAKPAYIRGKIEITRSKWYPSYLGQPVSEEGPGVKFCGDFKACWNHPECNCCFPTIKSDEDPQGICEQWSKKSNEEHAYHCQILRGKKNQNTFNSQ